MPSNTNVKFWRDPDLPGVEVRHASYLEETFRKHTHAEYSIGLIVSGRTTFFLEDTMHEAVAGQIALIAPNVVHVCNPELDGEWTYRMFYVTPALLEAVAEELFGPNAGLPVFPSPVVEDADLFDHLFELHEAIKEGRGKLEKETLLVQGLADLLTRHAEAGEAGALSDESAAVRRVKDHLAANLSDKVSLDQLSEVAHLSRYHLLRVFQNEVGLPPHAYQNQLRVDLGKQLLADGKPISEAAQESGFVDQSHFSRVFKQYTGATPKQYQAEHSSRS
ncbi:AraC family transcriptional regulator [Pseudodesulfovibrio sp. zrk46]|uniref:AraC family transcriptional regulator n=1 Tax=Pseudodesulfovibrio sp. zrk46 TaxID=2725288 RepID=UPI001FFC6E41|nr:AraC family transcriptional regulator [Pseudodesulfovibrio sp. zrk46]